MDYETFEKTAQAAWAQIPDEYKAGVDGLVIERRAEPHPSFEGIWTLGYCDTEQYLSDFVSSETLRSTIRLFWGSFRHLASRHHDDFDWEAEIHETVEHELRHHLEALAGEDQLGDVDAAMDQLFRRSEGEPWDPWCFRWGDRVGSGVWVVEDRAFIEMELPKEVDPASVEQVVAEWQGREFIVPMPPELGDLTFILLYGLGDQPPWVELVLIQERSWWAQTKSIFAGSMTKVLEYEADVEWVDGPGADGSLDEDRGP